MLGIALSTPHLVWLLGMCFPQWWVVCPFASYYFFLFPPPICFGTGLAYNMIFFVSQSICPFFLEDSNAKTSWGQECWAGDPTRAIASKKISPNATYPFTKFYKSIGWIRLTRSTFFKMRFKRHIVVCQFSSLNPTRPTTRRNMRRFNESIFNGSVSAIGVVVRTCELVGAYVLFFCFSLHAFFRASLWSPKMFEGWTVFIRASLQMCKVKRSPRGWATSPGHWGSLRGEPGRVRQDFTDGGCLTIWWAGVGVHIHVQ